jgi:ABC transporter transmembrane protein
VVLERNRPDLRKIGRRRDQVVCQVAGQQLPACVIDEVLEKGATQSLDHAADRLPVQCQRIDDAADILDDETVEQFDIAGPRIDRDMRGGRSVGFLRVFSTIFAVEYIVTGLAYVAVRAGWWPPSFSELAPPASLATTVAIFGLLVHLISFIPVIRQITRLADPYFVTNERGDLEIGSVGARHVTERRFATALIVALVVINQLQVAINIRLSFFNRDWFNAIQKKDSAAFWSLLFGVFCFWAAIAVVSNLVEYYTESVLKIRWRRWMTERYFGLWLDEGSLYRAALVGQAADNPDQRIAEDVRNFLNSTYAYSISVFVDSVDTRLLLDNPMDDPGRLHRSGNRDYRPRAAVLGRSGLFPRWHLANPFDWQATRSTRVQAGALRGRFSFRTGPAYANTASRWRCSAERMLKGGFWAAGSAQSCRTSMP